MMNEQNEKKPNAPILTMGRLTMFLNNNLILKA